MADMAGWWDDYFWSAIVILKVFGVALIVTIAMGLLGAAAKLSQNRVAHAIANTYTVFFRGAPEILILLIFYFGSAVTLTSIVRMFSPETQFVDIPPFWAGSVGIGLIVGAYATETFRGAFLGVETRFVEAARALGLNGGQTFFYIRLPQMWRLALPSFGNNMLSMMKDTALISIIGLEEIMFTADMATSVTVKPFTMYGAVAIFYLGMTAALTCIVAALEKHSNRCMVA